MILLFLVTKKLSVWILLFLVLMSLFEILCLLKTFFSPSSLKG
jgi:hypothetical protein